MFAVAAIRIGAGRVTKPFQILNGLSVFATLNGTAFRFNQLRQLSCYNHQLLSGLIEKHKFSVEENGDRQNTK